MAISANLAGKRIAILATHGFEESELTVPRAQLIAAGAKVDVVSPEAGEIKGWHMKDWGKSVRVDKELKQASASDYDTLVLPGGQMNPDTLRVNKDALSFIGAFVTARKPIGAICHAPWLLIEMQLADGLRTTSYISIKTDMINAGADWVDEPVVVDRGIITSRNPGDLDAFCSKVAEETLKGQHAQHAAE